MNPITYAAAQVLRVLPRERISRTVGNLTERRWPRVVGDRVVSAYCKLYDVDLAECGQQSGWSSFDAFFTRSLRSGVRATDAASDAIVSPADGRLDVAGSIAQDAKWLVKGRPYCIEELVGSAREAERYVGGQGCIVYLSPRDYHRVHAPVAGTLAEIRSIAGDYFPVNNVGIAHIPNLFVRNRRVSIAIDTPASIGLGRVTVIMIAAIVVGQISVTGVPARDVPFGVHAPNLRLERGDELGIFHLGSTAVVLFESGAHAKFEAPLGRIRVGELLACRAPTESAPLPHTGDELSRIHAGNTAVTHP
jgi:phosphatidylserine decarboxylase